MKPASSNLSSTSIFDRKKNALSWQTYSCEYITNALKQVEKITIVVPIYNAHEDLVKCLTSVINNTSFPSRLLLINDASTDIRISSTLIEYEKLENISVLTNKENLGFVKTVNRGFRESSGDVVILNSDTEVTPKWLENLVLAACMNPQTATVTAISNNAGAFAVPKIGEENDTPVGLTKNEIGRLVTQQSSQIYPQTPTGNGFCMYIKREVIDTVGLLDAENFPRGYGEENSFCMRAKMAGWNHVVDDTTFVFHKRSASFGEEKHQLIKTGRKMVDTLHPEYTELVRAFVASEDMQRVRNSVQAAYEAVSHSSVSVKPRILTVLHEGSGGTPQTNLDLISAIAGWYSPYVLTSNTTKLKLFQYTTEGLILTEEWNLNSKWKVTEFSRTDYRAILFNLLVKYRIELVHIRHLLAHTFDLPEIAFVLHIPVVLSFHDFYFSCPTVHLLDNQTQFCGGVCTAGSGQCQIPSTWIEGIPLLKHAWIKTWRQQVERMFQYIDAFVTTSQFTKEIYLKSFPLLQESWFEVIEHGRDLEQANSLATTPSLDQPIRILVPGNIDVHKGAEFIRSLKQIDVSKKLEFHFLGRIRNHFRKLGVCHGEYERTEFISKVRAIKPSFIGIFSIWAETYSHTLTEAWAAGVPVLASDIGTLRERVKQHGGGWLIDYQNPERAYQQILEIADDKAIYHNELSRANLKGIRSIKSMAEEYDALYKNVFRQHLAFKSFDKSSIYSSKLLRLGVFIPGGSATFFTDTPASTYVRILNQLEHPSVSQHISYTLVDIDVFLAGKTANSIEVAFVQRTAIPPDKVETFIQKCQLLNIPIVFEIDDNLLDFVSGSSTEAQYLKYKEGLEALARAATTVTTSTPKLATVLHRYNSQVKVVPNTLNENLWFGSINSDVARLCSTDARDARQINIVYIGSYTHKHDIELIRPVIENLQNDSKLQIKFFIIGGERESKDSDWYTRITIPEGCKRYPLFVQWLRQQQDQWDIAVAPLVDNVLNHSKSYLKYLEYSALGLPAVYSRVPPYESAVKDGVTGILTENTFEAWYKNLLELCQNQTLRTKISKNALEDVTKNYCFASKSESYLELLYSTRKSHRHNQTLLQNVVSS